MLNRLSAAELRGLAEESLALLKEFLYDERFPALFDLEVYGSIIGMFELNNLSKPLTPQCVMFHILSTALSKAFLFFASAWINTICMCIHCLCTACNLCEWLARLICSNQCIVWAAAATHAQVL